MIKMMKTSYDGAEKLWKGFNLPSTIQKNEFFGEKIFENLKNNPERVIMISHDEDVHVKAGDFLTSVIRVTQNLTKLGLQSGDVAGVACLNSINTYIIINACIMLGIPPNPVDVSFTVEEIEHMYKQTKPKIVVCDDDVYLKVKLALDSIDSDATIFTLGTFDGARCFDELLEPTGTEELFEPPKFPGESAFDKVLGIPCSSGTTGFSKGVIWSHEGIMTFWSFFFKNAPQSRSLSFSTTYWGSGFLPVITVGLSNNDVRIITKQRFSVETFIELIETHKVSSVIMPPSQAMEMVSSDKLSVSDYSSLRSVIIAGGAMSAALRKKLKENLPIVKFIIAYSMTEFVISLPLGTENETSVGNVLSCNVQAKIVDDDGNRLGVNEPGELRVFNSTCPFLGYFGNEEATKDAFDSEGFFITGDVGYFDEDCQLYIIDRKKEILKYKNYPYNPSEIEAVIEQIEGVKFASVVGIPDPMVGDMPTAAVVLKSGYEDKLTVDEIVNLAALKLSDSKKLHGGVRIVDELPMSASGKIQKRKVLEMLMK